MNSSILYQLPPEIMEKIAIRYGSIASLYRKIFALHAEDYELRGSKNPRKAAIERELFDIEDKLEEFGVPDGSDITSEIASDFGEIIVNRTILDINKYLAQFGTDFEMMRKWLQENYNI